MLPFNILECWSDKGYPFKCERSSKNSHEAVLILGPNEIPLESRSNFEETGSEIICHRLILLHNDCANGV